MHNYAANYAIPFYRVKRNVRGLTNYVIAYWINMLIGISSTFDKNIIIMRKKTHFNCHIIKYTVTCNARLLEIAAIGALKCHYNLKS